MVAAAAGRTVLLHSLALAPPRPSRSEPVTESGRCSFPFQVFLPKHLEELGRRGGGRGRLLCQMCGTSTEAVSVTSDPGEREGGCLRFSPTHVTWGVWRVTWGMGHVTWGVRRVGALQGPPAGRSRPAKLVQRNLLSVFIN